MNSRSLTFVSLASTISLVVGCSYDVVAEETETSLSLSTASSSDLPTSMSGGGATGTPTTGEATTGTPTTGEATTGADSESTSDDVGEVCRPPSISEMNGVFVRAQDVENGDGTLKFPFASLHAAVSFLNAENEVSDGRKFVFICLGDPFVIGSEVGSLVLTRGLSLIGGVDCSLPEPVITEERVSVQMATDVGIRIDSPLDGSPQCFSNLDLQVESSFLLGNSPSTIGIIASNAKIQIYKSIISVGTGDPGKNGTPYETPAKSDGSVVSPPIGCGQIQEEPHGSLGLMGVCGAKGGEGGHSQNNISPMPGEGIKGGVPGANKSGQSACKDGGDGGNGTSLDDVPISGIGLGLLDPVYGFLGNDGVNGESGTAGGGGGGGGAGYAVNSECGLLFSHGGNGGGGGCGGSGGVAGTHGGASIGLVGLHSEITISNAVISTEIAGDGGDGGPGQLGGKGSTGTSGTMNTSACSGGAGGQGGKGGWGGAGQGGHSLGFALSKDSDLLMKPSVMITLPLQVAKGGKVNNAPSGSDGIVEKKVIF